MEIVAAQPVVVSLDNQLFSPKKIETDQESTQKIADSFGQMFHQAINDVQTLQADSAEKTKKLLTGEISDLHTMMIAGEKASISLQFVIQVRNKAVEAYQEIMRMQV